MVIAAHHAHIGLAEQGLRLDAASQRRESADSYVDGSGLQLLDQGLVSEGDAADACARRRRRQGGIEAGKEEGLAKIARRYLEVAGRGRRVEFLFGPDLLAIDGNHVLRSEEHTSELQSLMRISYAVF